MLNQKMRSRPEGGCPDFCARGINNARECIMPSRAKKVDRDVAKPPPIPKELVELFMSGPTTGEAINDAGMAFKKALIE